MIGGISAVPFCFFGEKDIVAALIEAVAFISGLFFIGFILGDPVSAEFGIIEFCISGTALLFATLLIRKWTYYGWYCVTVRDKKLYPSTYKNHIVPQVFMIHVPLFLFSCATLLHFAKIKNGIFLSLIMIVYVVNFIIFMGYAQTKRNNAREFIVKNKITWEEVNAISGCDYK